MIESQDIKDAWDRIARTPDGLLIYRHLQRILMGTAGPDDGALPRLEGRRRLAADLMAYMAEGVQQNDRSCVTFAVAKPVAVSSTRGAGRRIGPEHFVPSYDTADTPFGGTGGAAGGNSSNGSSSAGGTS
jgi:hypothetical protein